MAKVWFSGWLKTKIDSFLFLAENLKIEYHTFNPIFLFFKKKEGGRKRGRKDRLVSRLFCPIDFIWTSKASVSSVEKVQWSSEGEPWVVKFIYSEKATKFCKISTLLLPYVVPVKVRLEILQNLVAFSEYMNFKGLKGIARLFWLFCW